MEMRFFTCAAVVVAVLSSVCFSYSGGTGVSGDPYQISTSADWGELMNTPADWDKQFILTADIDLAGLSLTPVGNTSTKFTGVFDGDGHVIRNAVINTPDSGYVGLFGRLNSGGQIRNLGAEDITITGRSDVGGLCGRNDGVITSCYATGTVTGTGDYVGGLCGRNYNGTIISCYTTGAVTGTGDSWAVGGLCGWNWGTITSCYATGPIIGTGNCVGGLCGYNYEGTITSCYATGPVTGRYYVGGLCGVNEGTITTCWVTGSVTGTGDCVGGLCGLNEGTITTCWVTGSVTGTGDCVGGLCGVNYNGTITSCYATGRVTGRWDIGGLCGYNYEGTITSCYATGAVTGTDDVGGLCGYNYEGTITSCYATGLVTGTGYVGGLCGWNYGGTITSCFWDIETSGTTDGVGNMNPDPIGVIGKMTLEMKTRKTFTDAGWDFVGESVNGTADIWKMRCEGMNYPKLSWQQIQTCDFVCPNGVGLEDLLYLAQHWLETVAEPFDGADITGDKRVDISDFTVLSENWQ